MSEIIKKTLTTSHIDEEIKKFAISNKTKVSDCDFNIDAVETHIRDVSDPDFKLFNENIKEHYQDKEKVINEHVEFSQNYKITIFVNKSPKIKLNYIIKFSELSTHPDIIISSDSYIPFELYKPKELLSLTFIELNKIKARHNIILNIFDDPMKRKLKRFVKLIYVKKFAKKVKIPLFDGINPDIVQESRLALRFLQKENHNKVVSVEKDEILAEFYKAQFGKNGLNCFGEIIEGGFGDNKENLIQEFDKNSVKINEDKKKVQYISKTKGFAYYHDNKISVENKIKIRSISRNQETLSSQEDNNIEVIVAQYDTAKDSIGEGVELVSETIHVNGHVGANSILEAHTLKIDGATHKDSTQFAKDADINRHKGTLRCYRAKVKVLEGGDIHSSSVDVGTCLGGSIYAKDVTIGHVKSNLKVYASHSINIKLMSGENNRLEINYSHVPVMVSKIKLLEEEIDELVYSLQEAQRHNQAIVSSIEDDIKKNKQKILDIKNSVYDAKISIQGPIHESNKIIFSIDDEHKITVQTDAREYSPFYIKLNKNNITLYPTLQTIKINS